MMILTFSCKKEVSPEVEVTVVNEMRERVKGAVVISSVEGAEGNLKEFIEERKVTDAFGKVFFNYKNTVLIDYFLLRNGFPVDSTSVLAEVKRQRGDENIIERTLVFK